LDGVIVSIEAEYLGLNAAGSFVRLLGKNENRRRKQ
jgi:hypothetical protein